LHFAHAPCKNRAKPGTGEGEDMTGKTRPCGRALVVEDDAGMRALICAVLAEVGFATTEVATGEEALEAVPRDRPDVVVLDVNLPGISGYAVCNELRERGNGHTPAIMFVSGERTESFDRVAGLLLGADDYVVKPFAPDELAVRAQRLLTRSRGPARPLVSRLTPRELEVLHLLADGLPQKEIATQLVLSPKTVGTHIERILDKLGAHSRAEAVAVAFREDLLDRRAPL
jgi:DNA-binding NarL/FixJ family response regulator